MSSQISFLGATGKPQILVSFWLHIAKECTTLTLCGQCANFNQLGKDGIAAFHGCGWFLGMFENIKICTKKECD
jgi:hypothetical protein